MHVQTILLRVPDTQEANSALRRLLKNVVKNVFLTVESESLAKETDPRAAAAAVAVSIAECSGPLDAHAESVLCSEFRQFLRARDGRELLTRGRQLTRNATDPHAVCDSVAPLLNTQLWRAQKENLLEVVRKTSGSSPLQRQAANHLKARLCL